MLDQTQSALVVIDVQGKLARTVSEAGKIVENIIKLIKGAYLFNLPVVVTEQNPAGLGPTIDEVKQVFEDVVMVEKMTFNS
jgi:nicotinamidase-related amidase